MQRFNRYVQLLRAKAYFPRGKVLLVPKWPGVEPGTLLEEFVEFTAQTGWQDPSGCSKLTLKVADPASSPFKLRLNRQEFGTKFADKRKTASKHYECQGIWHLAKKCPTREKRRGKTKNSPGKENPSKMSLLQGDRLNPGY
jgi:hypothetical protein